MADVDVTRGGTTGHPSRRGVRNVYLVERTFDVADWVTAKGSALASGDVIQAMDIPAETYVLAAGVEVLTALNGTTPTGDLGYGGAVDVFADGGDLATTGYLALGTNGKASASAKFFTAADTLDLKLAFSGNVTSGVVRIFAIMCDVAGVDETP